MKFKKANGLVYSIGLHMLAAFVLYFGVPNFSRTLPEESVIVVDMVNIFDLTNLPRKPRPPKKAETPKPEQKNPVEQEKPKPEVAKPEAKPEVKEEVNAIPIPDPAKPEASKPEVKKEPVKEKKATPKKEAPKKDEKKKKKKSDPFSDDFLKTLEESASKHRPNDDLQDVLQDLESDSDKPYNPDLPLSVTEKDAIASQIYKVWYTSSFNGADVKEGMRVTLKLTLDREGNVLQVHPVLEHNSSPQYPAFVESAERAVKIASPIKGLPPEKFASWSQMEMNFDPKMVN